MAEPIELELDVGSFLSYDFSGNRTFADFDNFDEQAADAELTDEEWARILGKVVPTPDLIPSMATPADEVVDLASALLLPSAASPVNASLYTPHALYASIPATSSATTVTGAQLLFPSSPESGSESSPQSSPPTAYGLDDGSAMNLETNLPLIEPFPPRSPIFEQPIAVAATLNGNAGVAASRCAVSRHLGQPLAQPLPAHASIPNPTAFVHVEDDTKKRPRTTIKEEIVAASSGVVLPRETLLKLSSTEMENYLQTLKASRQLTHEEERGLKKQLRLIKNREYAQESRKKKKTAHQELEGELTSLRTQNNELRTQNSSLQSEVVLLNSKLAAVTQENTRLRAALRQMHAFQQKKNTNNKRPRSSLDDNESAAPSSPLSWFSLGSAAPQSPKAIAGGVCLLGIIVFALSFLLQGPGMMFGQRTERAWSPTARVILQEETTYYRRSTWSAEQSAATLASPSSSSDRSTGDPKREEAANAAKCGYDNVCYLYAPKPHHVKTVDRDPSVAVEQRARELQEASLSAADSNRTAIPIPLN